MNSGITPGSESNHLRPVCQLSQLTSCITVRKSFHLFWPWFPGLAREFHIHGHALLRFCLAQGKQNFICTFKLCTVCILSHTHHLLPTIYGSEVDDSSCPMKVSSKTHSCFKFVIQSILIIPPTMNRFSNPWLYRSEKNSWLFFSGFPQLELSASAVQEQRSRPIWVGPQLCGLRNHRMQLWVPFAPSLLYQYSVALS